MIRLVGGFYCIYFIVRKLCFVICNKKIFDILFILLVEFFCNDLFLLIYLIEKEFSGRWKGDGGKG